MASQEAEDNVEVEKKQKKNRNKNFSASEEAIITKRVQEKWEFLFGKHKGAHGSQALRQSAWDSIAKEVSGVGVALRTPKDVHDKWKNMQRTAKTSFTEYRREQKKTGGGPPPKEPSQTTQKIVAMLKETPSFSGIKGGIETEPECTVSSVLLFHCECCNRTFNNKSSLEWHMQQGHQLSARRTSQGQESYSTEHIATQSEQPENQEDGHVGTDANLPDTEEATLPQQLPGPIRIVSSVLDKSMTSTSSEPLRKKSKRATQEDVWEKHCKWLDREMDKQDLEVQKLNLQIKLLEKLVQREENVERREQEITAQELLQTITFT